MTIIHIDVPAQPQNVGHLKIEVSTNGSTWQEIDPGDNGDGITQVDVSDNLDNPGTKLYVRLTANKGPVSLKTLKVIYQ